MEMRSLIYLLLIGATVARPGVRGSERELSSQVCSLATNPFFDKTYVTFQGSSDSLSATDKSILGHLFVAAFNTVSRKECDSAFRTISAVNVSLLSTSSDRYTLLYETHGFYCASCITSLPFSIFSPLETATRNLIYDDTNLDDKTGEQELACLCVDPDNSSAKSPTTSEFESDYASILSNQNLILFDDSILFVSEIDGTAAPSAAPTTGTPSSAPTTGAPSLAPVTSAPSPAPVTSPPSSLPSQSPSTLPSATPSSSPTKAPTTSAPTGAPVMPTSENPTFEPTVAPSKSPTPKPTVTPSSIPSSVPSESPTKSPTPVPTLPQRDVAFINEFHYDNEGSDENEFVEVAANIDLRNYTIVLYNGGNGSPYGTFVITDDPEIGAVANITDGGGGGITLYTLFIRGIQNGRDAIALVNPNDEVLEFISYEGVVNGVSGVAANMSSVDVGRRESGTFAAGFSIQRSGTACFPEDFVWLPSNTPDTPGEVNVDQFFSCTTRVPTPAPSPRPSTATPTGSPSQSPTIKPSTIPTGAPTTTDHPSNSPSRSFVPSLSPSDAPTFISPAPSTTCVFDPPTQISFGTDTVCLDSDTDEVLSFQDFEDGQAAGWRFAFVDSNPVGANFTQFMGRFDANREALPRRTWNFNGTDDMRKFYIAYDFYEIDSWDGNGAGGLDTMGLDIRGDQREVITFGFFNSNFEETGLTGSTSAGVQWAITSDGPPSQIGFRDSLDQIHHVLVEIPRSFFAEGERVTVLIRFVLNGEIDEEVGIDNFKAGRCLCDMPVTLP